jgi:hypothetical protein
MSATVLVLAHAADSGAESVAALLRHALGSGRVRIVRPETLSLGSWSHRVTASGAASTRITMPRGEVIEDQQVAAVFNRIRYLPVPRFQRASPKDRDYAGAEIQALVASWLAAFRDRVVHVVREHPWVTPMLPLQHWADAAARCGLPIGVRTIGSSARALRLRAGRPSDLARVGGSANDVVGSVLVAGHRAEGSLAATLGARCVDVARLLRFPLLEFRFMADRDGSALVEVNAFPLLLEPWEASVAADLIGSIAMRGIA